ncbi:MAG: hypothetical protein WC519_03070 [Parcubacteria group bacterium]
MKRILLSGGIILSVVGVVAGATYAAWQAQDTIGGNTVSTAVLQIDANGAGKTDPYAVPLPFSLTNVIPGYVSTDEERAIIENKSGVPMDLYMYVGGAGGSACSAAKLAWQSSNPGGSVLKGYQAEAWPTSAGLMSQTSGVKGATGNFTLIYNNDNPVLSNLWGAGNRVKIADAANFQPDDGVTGFGNDTIAVRQVLGFATDAPNNLQGTSCNWTLYFVGETVNP